MLIIGFHLGKYASNQVFDSKNLFSSNTLGGHIIILLNLCTV